jgi:hypothetical protein
MSFSASVLSSFSLWEELVPQFFREEEECFLWFKNRRKSDVRSVNEVGCCAGFFSLQLTSDALSNQFLFFVTQEIEAFQVIFRFNLFRCFPCSFQ